ncbi:MAG: RNA-binding S4 domain-containing protein [Solirubrobacteraceae bacterium]|nr:RNA-binding S4 domain-containing protein [Solirubrobacteraceae bacterium]
MRDVAIRGGTIRLGQLLKHAGLADSGGDAKAMLEAGLVAVDGDVETRRGRQLGVGSVVAVDGVGSVRTTASPGSSSSDAGSSSSGTD